MITWARSAAVAVLAAALTVVPTATTAHADLATPATSVRCPGCVTAMRESCQWFNAQYDTLIAQVLGFQKFLGDNRDDWDAPGVQPAADVIIANLDQSAAFLDPRGHTLFIVNYPDQSEYSPIYNGDSIFHLWFQLTQISDKMKRQLPSGQINANNATANVYGTTIRNSGVCDGA